jgi:signal transduction histidine kinase
MQYRDPLNANRVPNQIAIQMRDSGVDIDPSRLDQIFPPFVASKLEKAGIGLSISRSIAEAYREQLSAVPNEGPGAAFRFSLPAGRL